MAADQGTARRRGRRRQPRHRHRQQHRARAERSRWRGRSLRPGLRLSRGRRQLQQPSRRGARVGLQQGSSRRTAELTRRRDRARSSIRLADWMSLAQHIAHGNSKPGLPLDQQVACASNGSGAHCAAHQRNRLLQAERLARNARRRADADRRERVGQRRHGRRSVLEVPEGQPRHHRRVLHLDDQRRHEPTTTRSS